MAQDSPHVPSKKGDRDAWKKIQERTFTNWVNDRIRGHLRVAKKQASINHTCANIQPCKYRVMIGVNCS